MQAYVGLGTNLGDRRANLAAGLDRLAEAGARVEALSSVWETEPIDAPGSPWFWNMVARVDTERSPAELLELLLSIERSLGRRRERRNAPRTLDLDLLLAGAQACALPGLVLPHPRMWERRFVLEPLAEIASALRNPASGRTVEEERRLLRRPGAVRCLGRLDALALPATPEDGLP